MAENLKIFENDEFGKIRTIMIGKKPYFMASDVAKALGYVRPNDAIQQHCRATVKHRTPISGKMQEVNFIGEGDLYRLITHSKLASAEQFESWVFDDVIPEIRETGSYSTKRDSYTIEDPIARAERWIEEERERRLLAGQVQEMSPKADYYDNLVDANHLTNFRDTAKELGVPERTFIKWLLENHFLYRDKSGKLKPFAEHVNCGLFTIKDFNSYKNGYTNTQTLITPRGKSRFLMLLGGNRSMPVI